METEIIKVINIKTGEAINTVKELKKYVEELTDDLVKTDKTSQEYADTLEEIAKAQTKLTEVKKDAKNAMNYEDGSYKALNQELVRLKNEYRSLSEEQRNNVEVGGKILTRIQELDSELKSIDATMGQYQRNVGNYKSALDGVNNAYKNQRQELRALRTELEGLIPGTQEYNDAFNRAAEITHNLAYQQEMLKYSSKDLGDQLSNLRGITANMVAGFSAINAAMGLFGQKNEDVQKAMLKVQQTMALVQGLSGMDSMLKRTKGLSTAMKVWFTTTKQVTAATQAQTVATKANTTATNAQTVSTNAATVATKGLNAALKANPIGAVLTAVLAFTAVIKPLIGLFEKLSGKTQRIKEEAREAEQVFKDFDNTISLLDRNNRLEIIRMRLEGISELQIAIKMWGKGAEKVLTIEGKLDEATQKVNKELETYIRTGNISIETLKEMGYSQEEINDLLEETALNISIVGKKQNELVKNEGFKYLLDNLLKYVNLLKDAKTAWEELGDSVEEERLNEEAEAKKIAQAAEDAITDERILLKRRYETNKKLMEKYHLDTTALTKKYYKDLKELNEKYKIEPEKPVNMNFTATGFENIKKQVDEFFAKYKKTTLEILNYEYEETVKMLEKSKEEEYKYFQDLKDENKITEEQLAEEKLRIDNKYLEVKKQLYDKYRLEYKDEELALEKELFNKRVEYVKESYAKAAEDAKAELDKVNALEITDKKLSVNIVENIFGIDQQHRIEKEQQYIDTLYEINKKGIEDIAALWEQRSKDENLSEEERLTAKSNFVEALRQLNLLDIQYEQETAKTKEEIIDGWVDAIGNAINTISDLFGTLADTYQSDIDEQLKHNKISNKEAEAQYNKKVKPMMVAQATIQMLQGMVAAFAGAQQLGPIAGPIVGAALATAVGAMGALNIAKIQQTNPYSDSSGSAAAVQAPSTNYDYQPAYVQNTTGQNDVENLRNALTEQPIRAYVVESDISDSQKRTNKRSTEASF